MTTAPYPPSPVLRVLRDAAGLLDPRAAGLAEVIAEDYPRSLDRRPGQLLRSAGAEPPDLARLLTGAGFADLDDVRRQAARERARPLPGRERRPAQRAETLVGPQRILDLEQDSLARTIGSLQRSGALETAARSILTSRRRWIFGDLKSRGHAELFAAELGSALSQVSLIEATAAAVGSAIADANPHDSLTLFCFRRYSRLSVRLAERFDELGATVIAVTDSESSPVAGAADHLLRVITRDEVAQHSPTAVTATAHALATLAAAGAKGAARRARRSQELSEFMQWYEGDTELLDAPR
ncbi:MAG: SIS domain-containing protein [Actinomycetota bacterium]|nr:SIS domain-containing protein [Actinomycetota bacterium]